jgi:hypothetical protein
LPVRSGDAGGRQPEIGTDELANSASHGEGNIAIHCTTLVEEGSIHTEYRALDLGRVGDHSPTNNSRRPRDARQSRHHEAAGERLSNGDLQASGAEAGNQLGDTVATGSG